MRLLLRKHLKDMPDEYLIDDIIKKYDELKSGSNNFDDIIQNDKLNIDLEKLLSYYKFLFACLKIYNSIDQESFLKEVNLVYEKNETIFWKEVFEYLTYCVSAQDDTKFLRDMGVEDFTSLVEYTFYNRILKNSFVNLGKWPIEEIASCKKTINTFLYRMIIDAYDFESLVVHMDLLFQFGKKKYEIIWNLCEKYKSELVMKEIINELCSLESLLSKQQSNNPDN